MLLKALIWFIKRVQYPATHPVMRISGETYWNYRLWAEGFAFVVGIVALIAVGEQPFTAPLTAFQSFYAAGFLAIFGTLEIWRLLSERKAQIRFAELFYG